eukprot:CAMPEP_0202116602 /NCGR_PEP_ID=MMETSP0965-20130614/40983_1 /ASSEMBLY_ACC=CAM_ASM_000507 /TAXON_ID=4773 /ORGANISM="Schizochytrium aggregatum, Strain ATCC28209" /LENGTH=89 /DNA_ID=CAMNT_0048686477 /DNA_START=80 /DNA_END=349 /DNA_ORIENTATION=+
MRRAAFDVAHQRLQSFLPPAIIQLLQAQHAVLDRLRLHAVDQQPRRHVQRLADCVRLATTIQLVLDELLHLRNQVHPDGLTGADPTHPE